MAGISSPVELAVVIHTEFCQQHDRGNQQQVENDLLQAEETLGALGDFHSKLFWDSVQSFSVETTNGQEQKTDDNNGEKAQILGVDLTL